MEYEEELVIHERQHGKDRYGPMALLRRLENNIQLNVNPNSIYKYKNKLG
jgi:hypothetical protein